MSSSVASFPRTSAHIAIAGAGVIGLACAWRLAQTGRSVTVFERSVAGRESSWAAAGMLAPGGEITALSDSAKLLLNARGLYTEFVAELESESGIAIGYQQNGALDVAYSPQEWHTLQTRAALQGELGIISENVPAIRLAAEWPHVRQENLAGALFYPGDACVDPRRLLEALGSACRRQGVILREGDPVSELAVANNGITVTTGVAARFDCAIVAAGAWSSRIAVSGVPALPPVEPVRGHLIAYQRPPGTCPSIVRHGEAYFLQRSNGLLIAGASMEHAGFDRRIDPDVVAGLTQHAETVLPCLAGAAVRPESWIGFRPAGTQIHVGPWHSSRLLLAYGHFRNGILLAPDTAGTIVEHVNNC